MLAKRKSQNCFKTENEQLKVEIKEGFHHEGHVYMSFRCGEKESYRRNKESTSAKIERKSAFIYKMEKGQQLPARETVILK